MTIIKIIAVALLFSGLAGCALPSSQDSRILEGGNQLELRSMQTRTFDTGDKNSVVRNVLSTLQDFNFVIDKADAELGIVTATKLSGYQIRMTVTVRPKSAEQMLVRANAQYNLKAIEEPEVYQSFFAALSKSLFLSANSVE